MKILIRLTTQIDPILEQKLPIKIKPKKTVNRLPKNK